MPKENFLSLLAGSAGSALKAAPQIHADIEKRKEEARKTMLDFEQKELGFKNKALNEMALIQSVSPRAAELFGSFLADIDERQGSFANLPSNLGKTFLEQAEREQAEAQQKQQLEQVGSLFGKPTEEAGVTTPENLQFQDIDFTGFAQDLGVTGASGDTPTGRQEQASTVQNLLNSLSSLQQFGGVDVGVVSGDAVQRSKLQDIIKSGQLPQSGFASQARKIGKKKADKPDFSRKELANKYSAKLTKVNDWNKFKLPKLEKAWRKEREPFEAQVSGAGNEANIKRAKEKLATWDTENPKPVKRKVEGTLKEFSKNFLAQFEDEKKTETELDADIAKLKTELGIQ